MRSFLITTTTLAALALPMQAQTVQDLASEYANLPGVQQMIDEMFSPESAADQFRNSLPDGALTEAQIAEIGAVMSDAMMTLRPRLQEVMITGITETFTAAELQALIDFYASPEGSSAMRKAQTLMQTVMVELAPDLQALQAEMFPRIVEIVEGE
jgi:hypothetical protein